MPQNKRSALCKSAQAARKMAVAPYSNFRVGAALLTKSGRIYSGCNIENSSYGLTICAERVAVYKAISEGEADFTSLVVTTEAAEFCPPCGACRQVLFEYAPDLEVILLNSEGQTEQISLRELLPKAFSGGFLDRNRNV